MAPIEYGQQFANPRGFGMCFAEDSLVPSVASPLPSSAWGGSALFGLVALAIWIRRNGKLGACVGEDRHA